MQICCLRSNVVIFTPRMHPNSPFWAQKSKKISGEGTVPLSRPLPSGEGDASPTPYPLGAFGTSILAPSALDFVARHPKQVGQRCASRACRGRWSPAVGHPVLYRAAGWHSTDRTEAVR